MGLPVSEIPVILLIEDTIGKGRAGTNGKDVAFKARAVGVDVVESRSLIRCMASVQLQESNRKEAQTVFSK